MTTLADKAILSGADNRPPMLEKDMYDSWKSRMELYIINRQHGRMILESVENGPLIWPTIKENGVTMPRKYSELSPTNAIQADCDVKATNIILQGIPLEIYALVSNHRISKDLWEQIQLLMQGTSLTKQENFHAINDINIYNVKLEQFQVNTKFLNTLPSEWRKFVTDVKLVRDLHTTNIDQLHAYLGQHEFHANEVRIVISKSAALTISIKQQPQQPEFPQLDSGLIVPVFKQGDDPIDAINHMMSFLSAIVTSRYPTTNNQLRNSSNPRNQATINDGRVTLQPVQGRQISFARGEGHMSKQCTKPKRKQDDSWFKDKVLLVQAQANGQILHEEEIAFLADPGISEVALMANLSHYGLDVLVEKAQQLESKLYDGNVIKNTSAIVIPDFEETLMLAEEIRSKMLLIQQDPMVLEKKVNTIPVDYAVLNQLDLIDELTEVQNVFHQMEQHRLESKIFEDNAYVNVHECKTCLKLETELLNKKDFIEKETYDKLFRSYTTLEKYCISLEVDTQLNQEIFQRDNSISNQSAPNFDQYFEFNELKAQSQEKDMVIRKLKERIKSLSENMNEDKVKNDIEEIEMINIELDHREKDLFITTLKNELRKHKGKDLANNVATKHTIALEMLKVDVEPISPKLLNNRTTHYDYLRHTQEQAAILREVVEQGKSQNPLNNSLDSAYKYTKRIQELLIIIRQTCPSIHRVKPSTSASGSQPSGNINKDKIQQTPSSTQKNKVEAHSRTVKSSLKNKNYFVELNGIANVQHSKLNANSELLCVKSNGCMLSDNHDLCVLNFIHDMNASVKSKSVKKSSKRKV
ncbi:hypothetical protein Tco_0105538 [Tanacetum coccineum]